MILIFFGLEWSLYLSYKNPPPAGVTLAGRGGGSRRLRAGVDCVLVGSPGYVTYKLRKRAQSIIADAVRIAEVLRMDQHA